MPDMSADMPKPRKTVGELALLARARLVATAMIHETLGAIHGVSVQGVTHEEVHATPSQPNAAPAISPAGSPPTTIGVVDPSIRPSSYLFEIAVDGWSPSLHFISMQWLAPILITDQVMDDIATNPGAFGATIVTMLAPRIAAQRARADAGLELGWVIPNDLDRPRPEHRTRIDHLMVDRSIADFVRDADRSRQPQVPTLERDLAKAIDYLHKHAFDDRGGPLLTSQTPRCWVEERDDGTRHCGTHVTIRQDPSLLGPDGRFAPGLMRAAHDGRVLTVVPGNGDVIPETVTLAAVGRPLRDIIELHPAYDDRIIQSATMIDGALRFTLVPDDVLVGDLDKG